MRARSALVAAIIGAMAGSPVFGFSATPIIPQREALASIRPGSASFLVSWRGAVATKMLTQPTMVGVMLGDMPEEVDPIGLAQSDMQKLKRKIKAVIERNLGAGGEAHPLLKSSSKDFFERSEKTWRPMVALLLGMALLETLLVQDSISPADFKDDAMIIAEIVEIMHTSSLIHDTVLEDFDALEKGNPAHMLYSSSMAGNKISILAGDFLLSRASVLLASLRNTQVVEIMAGALESIMVGQMQLHRPSVVLNVDNYIRNIELRTGNLLASGCQCAALIAGHDLDSHVAKSAQAVGLNIGIAYQITRDMLVTERNYEKLWAKVNKCSENGEPVTFDQYELNEPLQRAATLIYVLDHDPALRAVVESEGGFKNVDQLLTARQAIEKEGAVGKMRERAQHHAQLAIDALDSLPKSPAREALKLLAKYVVDPAQNRLQRVNYQKGKYAGPSGQDEVSATGTMWGTQLRMAKRKAQLGFFNMQQKLETLQRRVSDISEGLSSLGMQRGEDKLK